MKRLLFITSLFLTGNYLQGQRLETRVKNYIDTQETDSFFIYSEYCNGLIPPFDSCLYEEAQYVFIHKNQQTHLVKIDGCTVFTPIKLSENNPFLFYLKNVDTINKEVIEPPSYIRKGRKTKGTSEVVIMSASVSHSCFHIFKSTTYKTNISIDDFDLNFKVFEDGYKNMHYEQNRGTKTYQLINLTTNLIKKLEQDGKFIKN
jgi:hypothetical protein